MSQVLCRKLGFLFVGACLLLLPTGCECEADYDLSGRWMSSFNCREGNQSFTGNEVLNVSQTGKEATFDDGPSGGSFAGTGEVCDNTFTWSGSGAGYREEGVWTLTDATRFQKTTRYTRPDGSSGTCTGSGTRIP